MTVKYAVKMLSNCQYYQLIGAKTGKKLADSWNNKESVEKYFDCEVGKRKLFARFRANKYFLKKEVGKRFPVVNIWVSGK